MAPTGVPDFRSFFQGVVPENFLAAPKHVDAEVDVAVSLEALLIVAASSNSSEATKRALEAFQEWSSHVPRRKMKRLE